MPVRRGARRAEWVARWHGCVVWGMARAAPLTLVGDAVAGSVQQEDGGICQAVHQQQGPQVGLHEPHAAAQQRQPRGGAAALGCSLGGCALRRLWRTIPFCCCCRTDPMHALVAAEVRRVLPCCVRGSGGGGGGGKTSCTVLRGLVPSASSLGQVGMPQRGSGVRQARSHGAWTAAGQWCRRWRLLTDAEGVDVGSLPLAGLGRTSSAAAAVAAAAGLGWACCRAEAAGRAVKYKIAALDH